MTLYDTGGIFLLFTWLFNSDLSITTILKQMCRGKKYISIYKRFEISVHIDIGVLKT